MRYTGKVLHTIYLHRLKHYLSLKKMTRADLQVRAMFSLPLKGACCFTLSS
jgi:hypothetical protein